MKVFTYYMPVPGLWSDESQKSLLDVWARSWRKQGWDPIVLTEDHAKTHPSYPTFKDRFWSLPTEYGHDYEGACFMRWLAVAQAGGGMMTDYDVINYGFKPYHQPMTRMTIYANSPPKGIFMGCVAGRREYFQDMANIFAAWLPDQYDLNTTSATYSGYHCSDLTMLERMFDSKTYPKPDWFERQPGCALFDYPDWKTEKLVHYGYAMRAAGYWPKCDHIEKIRPF